MLPHSASCLRQRSLVCIASTRKDAAMSKTETEIRNQLWLERDKALKEKKYQVGNHIVRMGKPNERYVILEHTTGSKGEKEVEAQRILPDGKLGATWRINYGSYA